jgi:hypothetical protein
VKELARLKNKFLVAYFPDIFRNTKLLPQRILFSNTPPAILIPNIFSYATIASPVDTTAVRSNDASEPLVIIPVYKKYLLLKNNKG